MNREKPGREKRNQARDGNGKFVKTADSVERDAEAMRLRSRGWTLREIAAELGFGTAANVCRALARHTEAVTGEAAAELRQAQLEQLDKLTREALEVMRARHPLFQQGRLCMLPDAEGGDGEPVEDAGPVLAAIDRLLRIQDRRAKLLGLDAPARQEVDASTTVRYSIEGVDLGALT